MVSTRRWTPPMRAARARARVVSPTPGGPRARSTPGPECHDLAPSPGGRGRRRGSGDRPQGGLPGEKSDSAQVVFTPELTVQRSTSNLTLRADRVSPQSLHGRDAPRAVLRDLRRG